MQEGQDESNRSVSIDRSDVEEEDENHPRDKEDNLKHGELTELEREINNNEALHPFPHVCTHVRACKVCGKRVIDFAIAMAIHHNEAHSNIAEDADGVDDAKVASIKK